MQSCIDPRIRIIVAHLKHAARRLDPIPTAAQTRRPALLARQETPSGIEPEPLRACYFESIPVNRCVMSIIAWIILGLIAGFIASKIVNKQGEGFFLDIVLGIVGALVGGFIFSAVGASGVTGFNLYSLVVAVIGAIVVLVLYHAVAGRRAY
jgi:uncharacterized membrane protein YeaQ/YmgE (transglycosylase-associated protein family)